MTGSSPSTPTGNSSSIKTPDKPIKKGSKGAMILATQGGANIDSAPRQQITQVKEFKFPNDTRSRRSPSKPSGTRKNENTVKVAPDSLADVISSQSKTEEAGPEVNAIDHSTSEDIDGGLPIRMKAHEEGKASIIAWGETRGRYLDD